MKSYEQLGRIAFEAHVAHNAAAGHFKALPPPTWETLEPDWKAAWVEAAKAVVAAVQTFH